MDTRLRELAAEKSALRAVNECLRRELAKLRRQVTKLVAALEAARRSGKHQAAPFRQADGPAAEPKKPGRKRGRRHGRHAHRAAIPPPRIDERYDAPLPTACPHSGGEHVKATHAAAQYQTEIPRRPIHREFTVRVGKCRDCSRRVQGRHALQTSDALGAAASQLGPDAHAALVTLNKGRGLPHGKCQRFFRDLFGISIARATGVRSLRRTAERSRNAHDELRAAVRGSRWVVPDETGWRVGGKNAWLHVFVGETATCYEIGDRSGDIAERLLGADWSHTMIHDGWSVYNRFTQAAHQQCVGHLQRRCRELLEAAVRGAVLLPRRVLALCDEAFAVRRAWRGHRLNGDERADAGDSSRRRQSQSVGRQPHVARRVDPRRSHLALGHAKTTRTRRSRLVLRRPPLAPAASTSTINGRHGPHPPVRHSLSRRPVTLPPHKPPLPPTLPLDPPGHAARFQRR